MIQISCIVLAIIFILTSFTSKKEKKKYLTIAGLLVLVAIIIQIIESIV